MNLAIELPEDIARQLEASWPNMPRRALEAIALEGYRSGALTRSQVGQLLSLSFWETESFLKERGAFLQYGEDELERDRATLDRLNGIASVSLVPQRSEAAGWHG